MIQKNFKLDEVAYILGLNACAAIVNIEEGKVIHNIMRLNVSLEEQVEQIQDACNNMEYVSFLELIAGMEKIRIVVTFIAILEMIKNEIIGIRVNDTLTDFAIFKISEIPVEGLRTTALG